VRWMFRIARMLSVRTLRCSDLRVLSRQDMTHAACRLLIADDDRNICKILSTLFEASGFRVVTAETFELAVHQAKVQRPDAAILALGPSHDRGFAGSRH
jgi:ActR/RegA family two-component response regulator